MRSLGGAVLVMSSVLYPYIYLACRSMFLMQGRAAADVARTLGAGPLKVFFRVQLPMARPAIMIGLTLVAMETLNDIGAVRISRRADPDLLHLRYLAQPRQPRRRGADCLHHAGFRHRPDDGRAGGTPQTALCEPEDHGRSSRRREAELSGWKKWAATAACLLPILSGFAVPFLVLGDYALKRLDQFLAPRLLSALLHSILVSGLTAFATVLLGFVLAYAARTGRSRITDIAGRLASFGYGVPGTVLAIGVLFPLAALDNTIDAEMRGLFGISTGLLMSRHRLCHHLCLHGPLPDHGGRDARGRLPETVAASRYGRTSARAHRAARRCARCSCR